MSTNAIFLLNLCSTWYMVGLIWMVQIVHYNMFDRVGREGFAAYEADHSRLITPIVGIPMLIEIATAAWLVMQPPVGFPRSWMIAGLILVGLIWLSTAFIQVPCHNRLAQGFDQSTYERLVQTNWIRTVLWSTRGVLMMGLLWKVLQRTPEVAS